MSLISAKIYLKKIVYLETIQANETDTYKMYCDKLDEEIKLLNKEEKLEFYTFAKSLE